MSPVNPGGAAGSSPAPRDVECNLLVEQIPRENLLLAAGVFDLKGTLAQYKSDWRIVSHTFEIREDGPPHVPPRERKNLTREGKRVQAEVAVQQPAERSLAGRGQERPRPAWSGISSR